MKNDAARPEEMIAELSTLAANITYSGLDDKRAIVEALEIGRRYGSTDHLALQPYIVVLGTMVYESIAPGATNPMDPIRGQAAASVAMALGRMCLPMASLTAGDFLKIEEDFNTWYHRASQHVLPLEVKAELGTMATSVANRPLKEYDDETTKASLGKLLRLVHAKPTVESPPAVSAP